MAGANHFQGFLPAVHARNLDFVLRGPGGMLVSEKIVLQAIDQAHRAIGNIGVVAIEGIFVHHGDDLVVRFAAVQHAEPADGEGGQKNIAVWNGFLRQDTDIEGISIPDDPMPLGARGKHGGDSLPQKVCGTSP
jgi:hypothetical protein